MISTHKWQFPRTNSFTSETSDEEVDYGSFDIDAIPHTGFGSCMGSAHIRMIIKTKVTKGIIDFSKISGAEINFAVYEVD